MEFMATGKTIIRRMVASDTEGLLPLLTMPEQRNPHYAAVYTEQQARDLIASVSVQNECWTVLDRETNQPCGYVTLHPEGPREAACCRMTLDFTGKAYEEQMALEAAGRMMQFAFEALNVRRLVMHTDSRDVSFIEVCRQLSMRKEGSASEAYLYVQPDTGRSVYRDIVYYAILKKEWVRNRMDG